MPQKEATGFDPTTDGGVPTKPSSSRQFRGNLASEGGTSGGVRTRVPKNNRAHRGPAHQRRRFARTARPELCGDRQERFVRAELRLLLPSRCS